MAANPVPREELPTERSAVPFVFTDFPVNNSVENIVSNIRQNVRNNVPLLMPEDLKSTPALIIGGGPSLKEDLSLIKQFSDRSTVFAINGAAKFLLEHGIIADYLVMADSRPENMDHVVGISPKTKCLFCSQVDPKVILEASKIGCAVFMYHLPVPTVERALKEENATTPIYIGGGLGSSGVHGLSMAHTLGYRLWHVFGFDFSNRGVAHHAYEQKIHPGQDYMDFMWRGAWYTTTPFHAKIATELPNIVDQFVSDGCEVYIYGDGLFPDIMRHRNMLAGMDLKEREKQKYLDCYDFWPQPKLHQGEAYAPQVAGLFTKGDLVLDIGAGSGRAAHKFQELGFIVLAVDLVSNALEFDNIPFQEMCLWDDPLPSCDWGFCSDVMEHIPPEKVDAVLDNIYDSVKKGVFFNISTMPDHVGEELMGETQHLTVESPDWWAEKMKKYPRVIADYGHSEKGEIISAMFMCYKE